MDSVDDNAILDNLERDRSTISRVENLRNVLRDLRNSLRDERLNLRREIKMTALLKFNRVRRDWGHFTDGGVKWRPVEVAGIPGGALKLLGDSSKTSWLACLGSLMYQRAIDELQDELDSFERRFSTPTSVSYRRKIYDLEAICCADLNRVRSRFAKSLQAFGNTIDSIEELCPRIEDPARQYAAKKPAIETNVFPKNAKHYQPLPRSKSIVVDKNQDSSWWTRVFSNRHSDSEMYSKAQKSSNCFEDPQITSFTDSADSLRMSKSFTVIFPCAFEVSRTMFRQEI